VLGNKLCKFGTGFFLAGKAQNVAVLVVQRGFAPLLSVFPLHAKACGKKAPLLSVFPLHAKACGKKATQLGGKKTSQMQRLFSSAA
jgi:hypothetical protein